MRKTEIYKLSEFSEVVLPFIVVYLFLTGRVRDRFNYETEFFIVTYFCENMVPVYFARLTALFNNTRTLKLKAQPTNAFFGAVNQVFSGSSQPTTTAELCSLSELCTTI